MTADNEPAATKHGAAAYDATPLARNNMNTRTHPDMPAPPAEIAACTPVGLPRDPGRRVDRMLRRAMADPDRFVLQIDYADNRGNRTRRAVSPIRFVGRDRFLGLCLCREEPRQFYLSRCESFRLVAASSMQMPVPIEPLS